MNTVQPSPAAGVSADAIPRDYNFAADILKRNLDAGRAGKLAYIDQRQGWTYGDLAERAERFGHVLRSLGIRRVSASCFASSTPSTGRPRSSVRSKPARCR